MIRVIESISEMRRESRLARVHTRRVSLVPTMGYLHAGHLSLLEAARATRDIVVLSIFVNPIQFGPQEDRALYPRHLVGDVAKTQRMGCGQVCAPRADEMYPAGFQTYDEVPEVS